MRREWLLWTTFAILIGLIVSIIYATNGRITEDLCASIRVGMTENEVRQIMWSSGTNIYETPSMEGDVIGKSWSDAQGTVYVFFDYVFLDGTDRVTKVRYFGATRAGFLGSFVGR